MVKCMVSGCPNRTVDVNRKPRRFFKFPKNPARVKVWLAALRETGRQDAPAQHLICEDHFLPGDVSSGGVCSEAIPIMPLYPDGPPGPGTASGAESSEEEEEEEEEEGDTLPQVPGGGRDNPETSRAPPPQANGKLQSMTVSRTDVSLAMLTRRFLKLLLEAPGGSIDLRHVAAHLHTRRRRVYDITNVLTAIQLIEKESTNRIRWIGRNRISSFTNRNQNRIRVQKDLETLKKMEATLDALIRRGAQELFRMTDAEENATAAYVTHEDLCRLQVFQDQTLIVVKAPEETKLEVPVPTEDGVRVHLKAGQGPIVALTCEVGSGDPALFVTLDNSRIRMTSQLAGGTR